MAKSKRRSKKKDEQKKYILIALAVILILFIGLTAGFINLKNGHMRQIPKTREGNCIVCVDPGHGGTDVGANTDERTEKEDVLQLALAIQEACKERGFQCVLTRSDDATLSLDERVQIAEENQADYFISLHRNSAEAEAEGIEVWVSEGCSAKSKELADAVEEQLMEAGASGSRGVREGAQSGKGSYYVLRNTSMPAVLVEMGFIQNEADNQFIDRNTEKIATAIVNAVADTWNGNGA